MMESGGLEVRHAGGSVRVPAGRPFVIGRGPDADLDLPHSRVSRRHAVVEFTAAGWTLTDSSSNGTFLDDDRITVLRVDRPVVVRLGRGTGATTVELFPVAGRSAPASVSVPEGSGRDTTVHFVNSGRLTIGRLPDNDVVVDDLLVSRRHAVLERRPDGSWELHDLGSGNGTFVNGSRTARATITPADVIGVGRSLLRLQGDRLVAVVDSGDVAFAAHGVSVTVGGKRLLDRVSFSLPGRCLLAIVGPSGAGKSTLLRALTGSRPADHGLVRYDGRDLYAGYDELRHRIGLVPQDDVLHPQLTVRRALRFAARLRFPADVPAADRDRRVEEVIAELGLTGQADQRIDTLSGGQRKRTSVALELLTKPSLLFLDEPTSGLDPGLDRSVMRTLRGLADGADGAGRTVVVVTHSVLNLEVCDLLLVLAPGGHVAYFGPPREALGYFGERDFADMFLQLDRVPGEVLAARFKASAQHRRYVAAPTAALPPVPERAGPPRTAPRQQGWFTQLGVLSRRYLAVIAADRQYALFLGLLPLVLSLLARLVPGSSGLSAATAVAERSGQPNQLLLVLVLGGALMGIAASIRELVKERPVYRRERAIGLSLSAYLTSKVLVLGVITAVQAALFTVLALLGHRPPDAPAVLGSPLLEVLLAVVAVSVLTMVVGLVISAFIDNADRGMPLLVLILMLQLVVSGGLFPVHGRVVLEQVAWLVPSRWAYAMGASTIDLNPTVRGDPDPLWEHAAGPWLLAVGVLAAQLVVLLGAAAWLLRRQDPVRR
jgi:ABC-type multidrug transport system ATPase subunit/pSer/pThr/pTyr-binding forkhead associated (FHA) protein